MKPDNIRENGERNDDNFIMLPTVLGQEYQDDKLGMPGCSFI